MKQFIWVYIVVLIISVSQFTNRNGNNKGAFIESYFSDKQSLISISSILFSEEIELANKENHHQCRPQLSLKKQKFVNEKILAERVSELNRNSKMTNYIFISECQINRLEGNDIIHPFNYFW